MKRPEMGSELGRVVDALPGLVRLEFVDAQIDYLNHRWSECTGFGVEESRGHGWQAAVHPEDLPALLASWPADSATCRRGYRWFDLRAFPLHDVEGRIALRYRLQIDIEDPVFRMTALVTPFRQPR